MRLQFCTLNNVVINYVPFAIKYFDLSILCVNLRVYF